MTLPNYHGTGATGEKPGVAYRRKQVEAAQRELAAARAEARQAGTPLTGVLANKQQLAKAQAAYTRIKKVTGG